jgi:hypothetical protein
LCPAVGEIVDWETERLQVKMRIDAVEQRLEELRRRSHELNVGPTTANNLLRARQLMVKAAQRAAAAQLAAANQLERIANAHESAAPLHDLAANDASNDLWTIAHTHIAEAHRSAARLDRELATRYRQQAEQNDGK